MASSSSSTASSAEATVEDSSCTHALVEFIEEGCTGVVPLNRVFGENFQEEAPVTVLWSNRREYDAVFIFSGSKKQCEEEEDRVLDEEASDENVESDQDELREAPDNCLAEKQPSQRKRHPIQEKGDKVSSKKRKTNGNKENKKGKTDKENKKRRKVADKKKKEPKKKKETKKKKEDDFIIRVGRAPMRTISSNVSDAQNKEETVRQEIVPYCGQVIELYSSDEENDEFFRCCAMVEDGFSFSGQTNKHMVIPVNDTEDRERSSNSPIHYTDGAKDIQLEKDVNALRTLVQDNENKRDAICEEIRNEVVRMSEKFEETQKTLALILARFIQPNTVQADGFAPAHQNVIVPVTNSNVPLVSSQYVATPATNCNVMTPATNSNVTTPAANSNVTTPTINSNVTTPATNSNVTTPATNSDVITPTINSNVTTPAINSNVTTPATNSDVITPTINSNVTTPATNSNVTTPATNSNVTTPATNSNVTTPATNSNVNTPATNSNVTTPATNSDVITPATNSTIPPVPSQNVIASETPVPSNSTLISIVMPTDLPSPINFEEVQSSNPAVGRILDSHDIQCIKRKSVSRKNFSSRLVRELFDEETRKKSNVAGKLGKLKLNPVLIDYVKSLTFQYYPLEHHEKEKDVWQQCVVSIDEANRRKPRKLAM